MIVLLPFIFIIAGISAVVYFVSGIFEAIGGVFEAIGSGINWIIEQFK
jgi:Flp pilus assembly pilin Flp